VAGRESETATSLLIERRYVPAYSLIEVQLVGASNPPIEVQVDGKLITDWVYEAGVLHVPTAGFMRVYIAT